MITNRKAGGFAPFRALSKLACLGLFALLILTATGCKDEQKAGPAGPPPVPVGLGKAKLKDMPLIVAAIGHVDAYTTVTVKPQIGTQITEVHFKEGGFVNAGAPLFTLDRSSYEAALNQAKANLARDMATLEQNRRDLARYEKLVGESVIARSEYENLLAKTQTSEATVAYDKAAIEKAKIDLGYCSIVSPISGRTGQILVNQGNIVKANETVLVEIAQVEPIYVSFSVSEDQFAQVRKFMGKGKLPVLADIENDGLPPAEGVLDFVDNKVSTTTGMITLKAVFTNKEHVLWPGLFANVSMQLDIEHGRVVVPGRAVQAGPQGRFVYVVGPEQKVEPRPVKVERNVEDEAIIAEGLTDGETVVVDGQLRLFPGAVALDRDLEKVRQQSAAAANATNATKAASGS